MIIYTQFGMINIAYNKEIKTRYIEVDDMQILSKLRKFMKKHSLSLGKIYKEIGDSIWFIECTKKIINKMLSILQDYDTAFLCEKEYQEVFKDLELIEQPIAYYDTKEEIVFNNETHSQLKSMLVGLNDPKFYIEDDDPNFVYIEPEGTKNFFTFQGKQIAYNPRTGTESYGFNY